MVVDRVFSTDVLVIGGGGAGCRAVIAAHDVGAETILAVKGELGKSGATVAPGTGAAWQAADECSSDADSPEVHSQNISDAGLGMADPRLARILAYEVLDRMAELESWGLEFAPDETGDEPHYSAYSCFGDQPRAHCILNSGHGHAGDIVAILTKQMANRNIDVHEGVFVTDLLVQDGHCVGAIALDRDGDLLAYHAGAVVLGTGGARQLFPGTGAHRIDTTGDGYAMALRAGAELTNMEYGQSMLPLIERSALQVPGSFWALFPIVRNVLGEDALAPYLPEGLTREEVMWLRTLHFPFSSRDNSKWLDICIVKEVREGRGMPDGTLQLDFSHVDLAEFKPSRPNHVPEDRSMRVVLPKDPLRIRSVAHAINGGVLIGELAQSTVPGLYAAGETAAGPHGADRLGGGMVTNCQVFGARAGRHAGEFALLAGRTTPREDTLSRSIGRLREHCQGEESRPEEVLAELQRAVADSLMVVRAEDGLRRLSGTIDELMNERLAKARATNHRDTRRIVEVENCLTSARLITVAALLRQESRGSHYREDFPCQDDPSWRTNLIFRLKDGCLAHERRSLE